LKEGNRIMTTVFSIPITANQTPAIPRRPVVRGRVALLALWLTQIGLAAMFIFVGGLKLTGAPQLVALFDAIGIGQWLRYVTGSIEVVSAVAHPSGHRRRVCGARNRVAHRIPRDRVGTSGPAGERVVEAELSASRLFGSSFF
jgi:hypothetical protein